MDFFPAGSAGPAFYVKPTRNNMTKLSFQLAEMKSELLGPWKKVHLEMASDGKHARELLTWYDSALPQNW